MEMTISMTFRKQVTAALIISGSVKSTPDVGLIKLYEWATNLV
jgi:hypothetical protein